MFVGRDLWAQVAATVRPHAFVAVGASGVRVLTLDSKIPESAPTPAHNLSDGALLAGYVPGYLRELLRGIATDWLAEFRAAQIVFVRVAGFRFQGPDDLPALAVLSKELRQAIDENGGVWLKFGADDKGLILLAACGLQSRSFEDNAGRASSAAALIHDAARIAGFAASMGVTGGKVLAGLVGSD